MDQYTRPDPENAALLTIDTQNDFTLASGTAEVAGTRAAVPRMRRLVEAFRDESAPIIHVVRLYREDGTNVDPCRRRDVEAGAAIVRPGTTGAELVGELKPDPSCSLAAETLLDGEFQEFGSDEWVMYKPRWGAFYRTPLHDHLTTRSISTLVICGCNFPNCPRTTIYEASERDYRLIFVPDATSGSYDRGLEELRDIGVDVRDAAETVRWLQ